MAGEEPGEVIIGGGPVSVNQGFDGGEQLPVAYVGLIDMVGIGVQDAVSQCGQVVAQQLGLFFGHTGASRGGFGEGIREPR